MGDAVIVAGEWLTDKTLWVTGGANVAGISGETSSERYVYHLDHC